MKVRIYVDEKDVNDALIADIQSAVSGITGTTPNVRVTQQHMGVHTPNGTK